MVYRKIFNTIRPEYQNWNVSRLGLQLSSHNILKPSGEWRCSCSSDAPTASEWWTISLPTQVPLILETWRYLKLYNAMDIICWHYRYHSTALRSFGHARNVYYIVACNRMSNIISKKSYFLLFRNSALAPKQEILFLILNSPPPISVSHIVNFLSLFGECIYTYRPRIPNGKQLTVTVALAGVTPWCRPHRVNCGLFSWSMVIGHCWSLTVTVKLASRPESIYGQQRSL